MGSTARAQGPLDKLKPLDIGKAAAQLEWMSATCGGTIRSYARETFARAQSQDPPEYARGFAEMVEETRGYVRTMGAQGACSLFMTAYAPGAPVAGLWAP